ncbi:MAG TPA: FAD-dependent oxidoreductase [Longimicrobium sp.]|nr:FAD-dependent oxidoreductase [Longimicrobium sp.]
MDHIIVGAGASGLYTAYRLLKDGALAQGDTVRVYEWGQRPGGRIYTYTFPDDIGGNGLYCEFGGMRFATDPHFPESTAEGHRLVQSLIIDLGLAGLVVPFGKSDNRLYYLRGLNVYENDLTRRKLRKLPYRFNDEFLKFLRTNKVREPFTADTIIGAIAGVFAPGLGDANEDRAAWCEYFANGTVPAAGATASFPAGTPARDIGYWNLLYDQLGDEGYDYAADGNGYSSNVIDWSAADAFENNNDVGSTTSFMRLDGGYSILFEALADAIGELAKAYPGSGIFYGQQLTGLSESGSDSTTTCTFADHLGSRGTYTVAADRLFLAMPRRALELVAAGCPAGYLLNDDRVRYYLESSINQPAIKIVMVWDDAWWMDPKICKYTPQLEWPSAGPTPPAAQLVGGPTVTDLPLRMVDYFANNVPGGPGASGGPYVLLASYDDMTFSSFWRVLETIGDYKATPSSIRQPLHGPTRMPDDSPLAHLLVKQLAETHGARVEDVPAPRAVYFQDWGQDPFGAGYHGWAAHYDICDVMDRVRAPYRRILDDPSRQTYVIGSCYSFDQGWVEGALCVAESVLREFVGLAPLNPDLEHYTLVCRSKPESSSSSQPSRPSRRSRSSRADRARNSPR